LIIERYRIYTDIPANDGVVAFTFPNSMSLKAYRLWKSWVEVSSMRLRVCIVPPRNRSDARWLPRFTGGYASIMTRHITQALVGLPPRSGIDIMQIEDFDAAMGQLWTENSESCSFAVPRKLEYLRWRYRDRTSVNYQLYRAESSGRCVGFLVTRKQEMFVLQLGLLVDFLVQGHQPSILRPSG